MDVTAVSFIAGGAGIACALFLFALSRRRRLAYNPWVVVLIISACVLLFGFFSIHSSL